MRSDLHDGQAGGHLAGDEDGVLRHLRHSHQIAERAAGQRPGDKERAGRPTVGGNCPALRIDHEAEAERIRL